MTGFVLPISQRRGGDDLNAVQMSNTGLKLGFADSWLQARGFYIDNSRPRENIIEEPWPLLTWPFLDFISTLDLSGIDLVELGAGNSTVVFSKQFRTVRSFENDRKWADFLRPKLARNVRLTVFSGETLDPGTVAVKPAEWVLVDFAGKRTRFLKQLVANRRPASLPVVVILDNSDWYRNGANLLLRAGYSEIPFFGLKSGQTWVSCTSFFFFSKRLRLKACEPFQLPPFSRIRDPRRDSLR